MNVIALIIGLVIGYVLAHVHDGKEFKIHIKHSADYSAQEITEEMFKESKEGDGKKEILDPLAEVIQEIDDIIYGGNSDED